LYTKYILGVKASVHRARFSGNSGSLNLLEPYGFVQFCAQIDFCIENCRENLFYKFNFIVNLTLYLKSHEEGNSSKRNATFLFENK